MIEKLNLIIFICWQHINIMIVAKIGLKTFEINPDDIKNKDFILLKHQKFKQEDINYDKDEIIFEKIILPIAKQIDIDYNYIHRNNIRMINDDLLFFGLFSFDEPIDDYTKMMSLNALKAICTSETNLFYKIRDNLVLNSIEIDNIKLHYDVFADDFLGCDANEFYSKIITEKTCYDFDIIVRVENNMRLEHVLTDRHRFELCDDIDNVKYFVFNIWIFRINNRFVIAVKDCDDRLEYNKIKLTIANLGMHPAVEKICSALCNIPMECRKIRGVCSLNNNDTFLHAELMVDVCTVLSKN